MEPVIVSWTYAMLCAAMDYAKKDTCDDRSLSIQRLLTMLVFALAAFQTCYYIAKKTC